MRRCPYCGEAIRFAAVKCRWCGEWLTPPEEPVPTATIDQAREQLAELLLSEIDQQPVSAMMMDPTCPEDWIEAARWRAWTPPLDVIAGEWLHVEFLRALCPPGPAGALVPVAITLRREADNPHDANAVRAEIGAECVGYVCKPLAAKLGPAMDGALVETMTVAGVVRRSEPRRREEFALLLWGDRRLTEGLEFTGVATSMRWPPPASTG